MLEKASGAGNKGFYGLLWTPFKMACSSKSASLDGTAAPAQMARFEASASPDGGVGDGVRGGDWTKSQSGPAEMGVSGWREKMARQVLPGAKPRWDGCDHPPKGVFVVWREALARPFVKVPGLP